MKNVGSILLSIVFLVMPIAASADDSAAITSAVTSYYAANIFTSINWTNIIVTEVPPYAVFNALNGLVSINPLVQDINGTWQVVLPSKGLLEADYLFMSAQVPKEIAYELTGFRCIPELCRNLPAIEAFARMPLNHPMFAMRQAGHRLVRARLTKILVPAISVRLYSKPLGRPVSFVMKPQAVVECLL